MKQFNNNRRKIYNSNNRRSNPNRNGSDSPYISQNGNSNNYRRNNKSFKDQYEDYLNKAKEAIGNGDEVLEQFFLQHAEHCFRQMEDSRRTLISKKIITPSEDLEKNQDKIVLEKKSKKSKIEPKTDFDDLANQLA